MDVIEKVGETRTSLRRRRQALRVERTEAANEALRTENRVLRDQLARERSRLEMTLGASNRPKRRRFRRIFALAITAGGAYLVGTKTGRERSKKLRAWLSAKREILQADGPRAPREEAAGALVETGAAVERAADRVGDSLKETAEKAGDLANEAAQKTGDAVAESTARVGRRIVGAV